jgi:transmembrane sensor
MSTETVRKLNEQIVNEASEWFVTLRFDSIEQATRDSFLSWLRISPEHVAAYLDVVALWSELEGVDREHERDVQALLAAARCDANVVPLRGGARTAIGGSKAARDRIPTVRGIGARWRAGLAAAAACAAVTIGAVVWTHTADPVYRTAVAEQRSIELPDGSTVLLNSRSRVRIRFTDTERNVDLVEGQALFKVAKDTQRPFVVHSGKVKARAVGTQFDVYRKHSETIVTVVEGRVAVKQDEPTDSMLGNQQVGSDHSGAPMQAIVLAAGEQVTVARELSPPTKANVSAAIAWTERRLIFTSTPLSSVVEEFNRYSSTPLVIDEGVADIPITAVFSTTNPKTLISFLDQQPELRVRQSGGLIHIEPARDEHRGHAAD